MMKVKINRGDFIDKLQIVQNIVSQRSTLPILSNYLLETSLDNRLWITSTNLEIGIKSPLNASIEENGSITIPAKKLGEILHSLPANGPCEDVELRLLDNNRVQILSSRSKFQIAGLSREDYPILPDFQGKTTIMLPTPTLSDMINKTIFAVSADETRYVLNGVLFLVSGGTSFMVSTDGRRLAAVSCSGFADGVSFKTVVPAKTLYEVSKVIDHEKPTTDVLVDIAENQIGFKIGETGIFSRLIEGDFPNWEQVIPKKTEVKIKASKEQFLPVTKRAALCIAERVGTCRYQFFNGRCLVTSKTFGHYEFEEEVELISYDGPEGFEIAFIPNYITDFLKAIKTETFCIYLTTSVNPALFRPDNDASYSYVVMPMKLEVS